MDGREFVQMPPPLLPGLPLDGGRAGGGGAAGRLATSTGHLAQLSSAKYLPPALNVHSHPGFSHLSSSLYPSYIPLGHLDAAGSGSPLLAQLGPHNLFESQKDGFYLPGHAGQSALHSQTSLSRASANQTQTSHLREKDPASYSHKNSKESTKERVCRNELLPASSRRDGRLKEELRARSVVDLTVDTKLEGERKLGGHERASKAGERLSPFFSEHLPNRGSNNGETKLKNPLQTSLLSNCNSGGDLLAKSLGSEQDRCAKDPDRHDENMKPSHTHLDKNKRESLVTSASNSQASCSCPPSHSSQPLGKMTPSPTFPPQPVHSSMYTIYPPAKESGREHKVIAPTFVPSVEWYDERNGPIQIASQARDLKAKESGKAVERPDISQNVLAPEFPSPHDSKRVEPPKEKGSVIRSNSSLKISLGSDNFLNRPGLVSPESRDFMASKDTELYPSERGQKVKEASKVYGLIESQQQQTDHSQMKLPEQKWKPFEMGNFATTQMAVLAAQHSQAGRTEEDAKKAYFDSTSTSRSTGSCRVGTESLHPSTCVEGSAMQNLIKYSGNFAKETAARQNSGKKSPFGGLGNMKLDASQMNVAKMQQQCLSQPGGKNLKKDPERPDSAKSFGRESTGPQGEVEVRHPPVGIAVAVARQKDNSGNKIGSNKGPGRAEEDGVDERVRHRDERLLMGRLEREQEKLLRESKELADFARMHPAGCATNGLNSNLMVTGGPTLAASGRWPVDPTSHLAAHAWLPRGATPSMWLAGHPYGLAHPALHQGMTQAFSPAMAASFPPAYHFARDPQSGQIMVFPTEQIPHFAELLDRMPSLWPAMYSPTRSSMQHAHQLQLLSQQQLLRQHEVYMLQQQAAHAMELQRSAQLDALELQRSAQLDALELQRSAHLEALDLQRAAQLDGLELQRSVQLVDRIKVSEQQAINKVAKQTLSSKLNPASHSGLVPRKAVSPSVSAAYNKKLSSLQNSPRLSPVPAMKTESVHKVEELAEEEPYYPHPASPPPRSPLPPTVVLTTKEETPEESEEKDLDPEKDVTSAFQGLLPELPSEYPFQSLPTTLRQHYPYLIQPAAATNADGLAADVPLPEGSCEHVDSSMEVKPTHLTVSQDLEPLAPDAGEDPLRDTVKSEEENPESACEQVIDKQHLTESRAEDTESQSILLQQCETFISGEGEPQSLQRCPTPRSLGNDTNMDTIKETCSTQTDFSNTFPQSDNEQMDVMLTTQNVQLSGETNAISDLNLFNDECSSAALEDTGPEPPYSKEEEGTDCVLLDMVSFNIKPDDPLAGMNALAAAAEMPQTLLPILSHDLPVDHDLLHGIALLSEMAEMELERRKQETESMQRCQAQSSLESLLIASTQILMEVLSCPVLDRLKAESIRLPRELDPNKTYSWMQKKEEPLFSIKSAIENMDCMELEYRVRLAELQRRYKEKQRELAKLQRRRDSEEKREEKRRSLGRRGPGRPRKRKHGTSALSPPLEREKSDSKSRKLRKCLLLSEDSEAGECVRVRQQSVLPEDNDEMENVSAKLKGRIRSWEEQERGLGYEVHSKIRKKKRGSDQEHLASKLNKALSLTKQDKLRTTFKFSDSSGGEHKGERSSRCLSAPESGSLRALHLPLATSKEGKSKKGSKIKKMEALLKVKEQMKVTHMAVSEVSSCSYNTDTEEDEDSLRDGWSAQPLARSRSSNMYNMLSGKPSKIQGYFRSPGNATSSCGTVRAKQPVGRKRPFCLLLKETEAGSSFSDSTEDSFDQGY